MRQPVAIHPPPSSRSVFVQAAEPDCCQRTWAGAGPEQVTAPFWAAAVNILTQGAGQGQWRVHSGAALAERKGSS